MVKGNGTDKDFDWVFGLIDFSSTCAENDNSNLGTMIGQVVCAYIPCGRLGVHLFW
jgi:hypothetical protein